MKKLVAAGVAALMLAGAASARDMWIVGRSSDTYVFADADTLSSDKPGHVQIWSDWYKIDSTGAPYLRGKLLDRFNCKEKTSQGIQVTFYKPDGGVEGAPDKSAGAIQHVPPNTLMDGVMGFACSRPDQRPGIRINPGDEIAWIRSFKSNE